MFSIVRWSEMADIFDSYKNSKMDSVLRDKLNQLNGKCEILVKSGKYN